MRIHQPGFSIQRGFFLLIIVKMEAFLRAEPTRPDHDICAVEKCFLSGRVGYMNEPDALLSPLFDIQI